MPFVYSGSVKLGYVTVNTLTGLTCSVCMAVGRVRALTVPLSGMSNRVRFVLMAEESLLSKW